MKKVTKAIFPVAGLGTRFLPATKAIPKEMLPIVDKPLIQYAVEEAISAGISELIFIFFNIFSKLFFDTSSMDSGDTATGRGFKLPLVISTSIKAKALKGSRIVNISKYLNIIFNLLTSPLHQSLIVNLSIFHNL